MKKYALFLILVVPISAFLMKPQAKKYPAEIEDKIKLVENSLAGWVQTGSNDTWNLAERMKKYDINGVSIAVIHNYQIEWAKGYGFADVSENRPDSDFFVREFRGFLRFHTDKDKKVTGFSLNNMMAKKVE